MEQFPPMPLEAWADSKETLHRYAQVVGKIRLVEAPRRNHWWHVPFHLTARGTTTRPMGRDPVFAVDFDLVAHRLVVATERGEAVAFPLAGHSVASFHARVFAALRQVGVETAITPVPFDLDPPTPFPEDTADRPYDPAWVHRYWRILGRVNLLLEEFAGRFTGKTSPVHHFWHTFDIAVTRFSDREVPHPETTDVVTREAYSHEVISFGFWFGDAQVPYPAFYSYTAPEPDGLADRPLLPAAARWVPSRGSHLAVLPYDEVRTAPDPRGTVLDFLESAYRAGGELAGWDVERLAAP